MLKARKNKWTQCDFCARGIVVVRNELLRFSQQTPQGELQCSVTVPVGRCDICGFAHVDGEADAAINEEVDRARRSLNDPSVT
jgi:hypothetical protein